MARIVLRHRITSTILVFRWSNIFSIPCVAKCPNTSKDLLHNQAHSRMQLIQDCASHFIDLVEIFLMLKDGSFEVHVSSVGDCDNLTFPLVNGELMSAQHIAATCRSSY